MFIPNEKLYIFDDFLEVPDTVYSVQPFSTFV